MTTALIAGPLLEGASIREEAGEYVGATAVYIVGTDESPILFKALTVCPQPSDPLNADLPNLRVSSRVPTVVGYEGGTWKVRVEVEYAIQRPTAEYSLRGSSSMQQRTTMNDKDGNQITTSYQDDVQVGTIDVMSPTSNISFGLTVDTDHPEAFKNTWIGYVNSDDWQDGAAGSWMCSSVSYELADGASSPRKYNFTFEFEKSMNPDGWVYTVTWKDPEKGTYPADLVDGVGIKDIQYHESRAFGSVFPSEA